MRLRMFMTSARPKEVASALSGVPEEQVGRKAIIYRPTRNAMQSGSQKTKQYKLVFPHGGNWQNPLMGWASSGDPLGYLSLSFPTESEARRFCELQGFDCEVQDPLPYERQFGSYSDNFKYSGTQSKLKEDEFW